MFYPFNHQFTKLLSIDDIVKSEFNIIHSVHHLMNYRIKTN
jgi:hypothetical protein